MMTTPQMTQTNKTIELAAQCKTEPMVFDGILSELCSDFEAIILDRMQHTQGKTGGLNVGGWKSTEDFFTWPYDAITQLRQLITDLVGSRSLIAWAMVNRAGSFHPRHQHRAAHLSGVYYVTAGSLEALAPTVFECPCDDGRPIRASEKYDLEVEPHPGRLVLCRGSMWHRVGRYMGDLPRITIAFDVRR